MIPATLLRLAYAARVVVSSGFDREFDIVDIKVAESVAADRIVLCESNATQSGFPRAPRLHIVNQIHPRVETYSDVCTNEHFGYKLGWNCEDIPRSCATQHACDNEPDDTIVIQSDLDEIVAASVIKSLKATELSSNVLLKLSRNMAVFVYGFFWEIPKTQYSTTKAFTCGGYRSKKPLKVIEYPRFTGWHCSYCFPVDEYLSKMHSMLKGDGWLSLSDHYWSMEMLYSFRQNGIPLNGQTPMMPSQTKPPASALLKAYLTQNTAMKNLPKPVHPFTFPMH